MVTALTAVPDVSLHEFDQNRIWLAIRSGLDGATGVCLTANNPNPAIPKEPLLQGVDPSASMSGLPSPGSSSEGALDRKYQNAAPRSKGAARRDGPVAAAHADRFWLPGRCGVV